MRAVPPPPEILLIAMQFEAAPGVARVRTLTDDFAAATDDIVAAILDEASRFAETWLVPLNDAADKPGCRLADGRVMTAPGHNAAWRAFVEAGWTTLDHPTEIGGQGLPLSLAMSVQVIFDRACAAFGMLPVPQRSAAKLIAAHGDQAMREEWLPPLVAGEWGATICISEVEAGSDVGRIRTRAEPLEDGLWAITGEKCWISFGDHDLSPRIGHCLLARTPGARPGAAGLSLFLVPDRTEDRRNSIFVRRLEHKMGLHGSPTCALGFEGATGRMIGLPERGLTQMFTMITNMRLSVGAQGLGLASGALDIALNYARERRQGGPLEQPVAIARHPDVQRNLLCALGQFEPTLGLMLAAANHAEIAAHSTDEEEKADSAALTGWLLPIIKTRGGEVAQHAADTAIQVLGGAGFTREWPVEQTARDARVLTIYEGTTGMQALDLVERRLLKGEGRGLAVFLREARAELAACPISDAQALSGCLDHLTAASTALAEGRLDPKAAATSYLHLAALAATGWISVRLLNKFAQSPSAVRLVVAARAQLAGIASRASQLCAEMNEAADMTGALGAFIADG